MPAPVEPKPAFPSTCYGNTWPTDYTGFKMGFSIPSEITTLSIFDFVKWHEQEDDEENYDSINDFSNPSPFEQFEIPRSEHLWEIEGQRGEYYRVLGYADEEEVLEAVIFVPLSVQQVHLSVTEENGNLNIQISNGIYILTAEELARLSEEIDRL